LDEAGLGRKERDGFQALVNSTASSNTAVGDGALSTNTSGSTNTATSVVAVFKNRTGNQNPAFSAEALFSNSTGSNNTADGFLALETTQPVMTTPRRDFRH
jgi:hypothetical protein